MREICCAFDRVAAFHTADTIPYLRNNNGLRKHVMADDYSQQQEPWGRYMSPDPAADGAEVPLHPGWERGTVDFTNPLYVPHNYGAWKQDLAQKYHATGQGLSRALLADGYDGVISHDKYGVGEIVDIRPKDQRGHTVLMTGAGGFRDLYHHTSPANAEAIRANGFKPSVSEPGSDALFFTTDPNSEYARAFGEGQVHLRVPQRMFNDFGEFRGGGWLDDEFPSGEQHWAIPRKLINPRWVQR